MAEHRTIEAAIFDLGGVIFGISLEPIFRSWAESSGIPPQKIAEKFKADSHHDRFEIGEISPEEYRAHICDTIGAQLSPEDFDRGWAVRFIGSEGSLDISRQFLDSKPDRSKKTVRNRIWFSVITIIVIIALTIWGEVS